MFSVDVPYFNLNYNLDYIKGVYNTKRLSNVNHNLMYYQMLFNSDVDSKLEQDIQHLINSEYMKRLARVDPKTNKVMKFIIKHNYLNVYRDYLIYSDYCHIYNLDSNDLSNDWVKLYIDSRDIILRNNDIVGLDTLKYYSQYFKNCGKKLQRVKDKINSYRDYEDEEHHLYFLTCTLRKYYSIDTITKEAYQEVRTKFRKHLAAYSDYFVCNKDFGITDTKRLHFHGVALLKDSEITSYKCSYKRKFGFCHLQEINTRSDLISRYIDKLSFHALKVNYGSNKENLIYSRIKH